MNPLEFHRQLVDRTVLAPLKVGQTSRRLAQMAAAEPGERPYDVVHEEVLLRLRRYEPAGESRETPLVIVYPFVNDPSILDFRPDRSVVGGFLERGFPVYVLEWRDASPLDRSIGLDDVVTRYLPRCVDVAAADAGSDEDESGEGKVHLLGYSTGAPIAAAYAALHPERVRTLLLQGPPLDFEAGGAVGQLREIAANLDLDRVEESLDVVPAPLVEGGFALRKPVEYAVTAPLHLWDRFDDEAFVEDYGRRLSWVAGGIDVPAALFRQFVEDLLLENRLLRDAWRLDGRPVDLENLAMPVALVVGRDDKFVPREASEPFLEAIPSEDAAVFEFPTGHVGISVAPGAHEEGWPRVHDWLADRT